MFNILQHKYIILRPKQNRYKISHIKYLNNNIYDIYIYISLLQIQATVFKYDICSNYLKNFSWEILRAEKCFAHFSYHTLALWSQVTGSEYTHETALWVASFISVVHWLTFEKEHLQALILHKNQDSHRLLGILINMLTGSTVASRTLSEMHARLFDPLLTVCTYPLPFPPVSFALLCPLPLPCPSTNRRMDRTVI